MVRYPDPYDDPRDAQLPLQEEAVVDFAFADTVVAADLDDAVPPPSGILLNDETGHMAHHVMPVAYPPATPSDPGVKTRVRVAWARVRHDVQDMQELWDATACVQQAEGGPMATVGRRVRTLLSFFEWDRADVLRAAWIGLAVLVLVATLGAIVLQVGSPAATL